MAGIRIAPIPYPDELKDSVWQKKKGVLGKAKKTGIGDLLKKAEGAHGKIDFMKLNPAANNPKNMDELEKAKKEALAYYKAAIQPFSKQLDDIEKQAEKVKKDNSTLLKGASGAIDDIIKTASRLKVTLKSFDMEAEVKDAEDRIKRRQELAAKFLNDSLKKFVIGAKAFFADPTPESWDKNIKQQGRSVSNSVKELEAYNKAFWKEFEKFKGFDLPTLKLDSKDEAFGKKSSALVKAALEQVKQIAAFKG